MLNFVSSGFGVGGAVSWLGNQVESWVNQQIDRKLNEAGAAWLARSQSLAPVRTGYLRSQEDYQIIGKTLTIIMGASYDLYTELGTRNMMPHPHALPALNEMNRIFGTDVELHFNRTGGSQWHGVYAHRGQLAVPHGLTRKQRAHLERHVLPNLRKQWRGNVRRAKIRVRPFS